MGKCFLRFMCITHQKVYTYFGSSYQTYGEKETLHWCVSYEVASLMSAMSSLSVSSCVVDLKFLLHMQCVLRIMHKMCAFCIFVPSILSITLQWRHNEYDDVSNHQPHDCLLSRFFRRRLKKTSKLRVTGLCVGNSPVTGEFPTQRTSNAENVSIWWRHHDSWLPHCFITTESPPNRMDKLITSTAN